MLKNLGRHGDLLIKRVDNLPKGLRRHPDGILREGEATGHNHTLIADPKSEVFVFIDEQGNKFFQVKGGAVVTHPEHKTIEIVEGYYEVLVEKEYDPFKEEIRRVAD